MYIPTLHEVTDLSALHGLMRAHPLGSWATVGDGEIIMNHVPFVLDPSQGAYGTLRCHVARANSVWQKFSRNIPSVIAFHGPQTYVSPSWYPSRQSHGKVVPTWNYVVVHAHAIPRVMEERAQVLEHLTQLTIAQEAGQPVPWRISDAPADFIEQMTGNIVALEMPIVQIFGKWKVSQNRSAEDRDGVVAGLQRQGDALSSDMAGLINSG
ncbi:MAG TPA: FMN-binding negative transcriptional regulator [Steroidobacteraceae bacterium]|nr:FMN-binding negative transcriptional regulator [Steroidobacteraceae bacterium]